MKKTVIFVVLAMAFVNTVITNANPVIVHPTRMLSEQINIEIKPGYKELNAIFSGQFNFDYISFEVEKIMFPVPSDAESIVGWMDEIPLSYQWSDEVFPTSLPEMLEMPIIEWYGTFSQSGGILKIQYEHSLIKRPGEFIYFYPFVFNTEGRDPLTTVQVEIEVPVGFAVVGVWLDDIPLEYSIGDRRLQINFESDRVDANKDLLVSLVSTQIYVAIDGDDITGDGSEANPFRTIQKGINSANDGDTIIVSVGTYYENIDFKGKNIILTSTAPTNEDTVNSTIIDGNDANSVVTFSGTEDSNCILSGFTITDGNAHKGGGIYGNGTLATIQNNVITGNGAVGYAIPGAYGWGGGLFNCDGLIQDNIITYNYGGWGGGLSCCDGVVKNNIISFNDGYAGGGMNHCNGVIQNNLLVGNIALYGGALTDCGGIINNCTVLGNWRLSALLECNGVIQNCIIWKNGPVTPSQIKNCSTPAYCCIENWDEGGIGNISDDPCFVRMGYWQWVDTGSYYYWAWIDDGSDYHLKSQVGRWNPDTQKWVKDDVTSPCIDAGDMASPIGYEPFPNGGRINMGAFGGTEEASKSYFGGPVCETIVAGDINGDCIVNFKDFAFMAYHWLEDKR